MKMVLYLAAFAVLAITGMLYACVVVGARMDDQFEEYSKKKR